MTNLRANFQETSDNLPENEQAYEWLGYVIRGMFYEEQSGEGWIESGWEWWLYDQARQSVSVGNDFNALVAEAERLESDIRESAR
jgi:hypothetical protein